MPAISTGSPLFLNKAYKKSLIMLYRQCYTLLNPCSIHKIKWNFEFDEQGWWNDLKQKMKMLARNGFKLEKPFFCPFNVQLKSFEMFLWCFKRHRVCFLLSRGWIRLERGSWWFCDNISCNVNLKESNEYLSEVLLGFELRTSIGATRMSTRLDKRHIDF